MTFREQKNFDGKSFQFNRIHIAHISTKNVTLSTPKCVPSLIFIGSSLNTEQNFKRYGHSTTLGSI